MSKVFFTAEVFDLSFQGYGVLRHPNGKIFFVHNVWLNEIAEFECQASDLKNLKTSFAKVKNFIKTSPNRRVTKCKHWGFSEKECAGCPWMMIDYQTQLFQKSQRVLKALTKEKIEFSQNQIQEIWPSLNEWGYRNRADFKTNGNQLGFVSAQKTFMPIQECLVLSQKMKKQFKKASQKIQKLKTKTQNLLPVALDETSDIESLSIPNDMSFQQGNTEQNDRMRSWLKDHLKKHNPNDEILELFCGDGNFTEVLSDLGFSSIYAIEGDERAIFQLKQKSLPGAKVFLADLYNKNCFHKLKSKIHDAKILILDPPRQGLKNADELFLKFSNLKTIYSFSCYPESFAKNAKAFERAGFSLSELQPVDLFPQTPHVEILAKLVKKKEE